MALVQCSSLVNESLSGLGCSRGAVVEILVTILPTCGHCFQNESDEISIDAWYSFGAKDAIEDRAPTKGCLLNCWVCW